MIKVKVNTPVVSSVTVDIIGLPLEFARALLALLGKVSGPDVAGAFSLYETLREAGVRPANVRIYERFGNGHSLDNIAVEPIDAIDVTSKRVSR